MTVARYAAGQVSIWNQMPPQRPSTWIKKSRLTASALISTTVKLDLFGAKLSGYAAGMARIPFGSLLLDIAKHSAAAFAEHCVAGYGAVWLYPPPPPARTPKWRQTLRPNNEAAVLRAINERDCFPSAAGLLVHDQGSKSYGYQQQKLPITCCRI